MKTHTAKDDNNLPIDDAWLESVGTLENSLIVVEPMAINHWYDGVEVCNQPTDDPLDTEDDESPRILAISHFPITRGDVRMLCLALGIRCPG